MISEEKNPKYKSSASKEKSDQDKGKKKRRHRAANTVEDIFVAINETGADVNKVDVVLEKDTANVADYEGAKQE